MVLECGPVLRHVQFKSRRLDAKTSTYKLNTRLAERPSGCVVWLGWSPQPNENRVHIEYRWFGGSPGEPLPDLGDVVAKHAKANAAGVKLERPGIRRVNLGRFELSTERPSSSTGCSGPYRTTVGPRLRESSAEFEPSLIEAPQHGEKRSMVSRAAWVLPKVSVTASSAWVRAISAISTVGSCTERALSAGPASGLIASGSSGWDLSPRKTTVGLWFSQDSARACCGCRLCRAIMACQSRRTASQPRAPLGQLRIGRP